MSITLRSLSLDKHVTSSAGFKERIRLLSSCSTAPLYFCTVQPISMLVFFFLLNPYFRNIITGRGSHSHFKSVLVCFINISSFVAYLWHLRSIMSFLTN